ncbi:MAG: glycosyltransferase family 2 protein, partial [Bacteroidota bacterium]|nr:glycosyltransferase family 2 protein [Bacteroidota bacterium]
MATYNGSRFLAEQLDSILAQTYRPIELVVVDDNSTDNTWAVLERYASKFPDIRIEQNRETLGYIKNFEKGMLLAKGDLIALSDQDDRWHPEKLSLLYEALGNQELIYSNSELMDENGVSLGKKMSDIRNQISYTDCLMYVIGAWAPGHAMLFKKDLFERCRPFPDLVTHDFWLGFVAACKSPVLYYPGSLVYYRQHTQNA